MVVMDFNQDSELSKDHCREKPYSVFGIYCNTCFTNSRIIILMLPNRLRRSSFSPKKKKLITQPGGHLVHSTLKTSFFRPHKTSGFLLFFSLRKKQWTVSRHVFLLNAQILNKPPRVFTCSSLCFPQAFHFRRLFPPLFCCPFVCLFFTMRSGGKTE